MADLQKAKSMAAQLGEQPPAGVVSGTPAYDNWVQQWFDAGVAAGDPRLVAANGGGGQGGQQAQASGGGSQSDADYIAEVRASGVGKSEDYARFSDPEILAWKKYYAGGGKFKNIYGDVVDKPDERGPNTPGNRNGTGDQGDYGRGWNNASLDSEGGGESGGAGGGQGGKGGPVNAPPPKPTTFGSQLSMTGNPMQDMLISQFNSGQDPNTYQNNIFGLGEDMRMGGTGRNADQGTTAPTRQGQSLGGGGIWWGQDKDTFSGFDASQKNADPAAPATAAPVASGANTAGKKKGGRQIGVVPQAGIGNFPTPPSPVSGAAPVMAQPKGRPKPFQGFQGAQPPTPMAGMMRGQFNSPARNRPSYF